MINLRQEFTIHPIGQGLFYTGVMHFNTYNSGKFIFAFDCGSVNKTHCSDEVARFRNNILNGNELDLLVISHFDADHVSHIGELLKGGIKVKKLVMPFLSFSQRLLLTLKVVTDGNNGGGDDFTLALIIDPLGTLGPNLDGGSEIIVIEKGPDGPPVDIEVNSQSDRAEENEYVFDFEPGAKEALATVEMNEAGFYAVKYKLSKVKDNRIGFIAGTTLIKILEFVFYRRDVGKDEKKYFERIADEFLREFKIEKSGDAVFLKKVIEAVKAQKNGTRIKKFFEVAKEGLDVGIKARPLDNLNTTALCMLHQNLPGIWLVTGQGNNNPQTGKARGEICIIQKPSSNEYYEEGNNYYFNDYWHWHWLSIHPGDPFFYPNALFTSDGYLIRANEVDLFYDRYRKRWNNSWLIQIPHHGSKENSGTNLLSRIFQTQRVFINYGTDHQMKKTYLHPDKEVLDAITATGHAKELIPVNEFVGLKFNLNFY
jgi:hypothetical protein